MRVGVVCPYDIGKPGGVQQLSGELAAHLRARGDEVVFIGAGQTWFHGGPGLDDVTVGVGRTFSVKANESLAPVSLSPMRWGKVRAALANVDVIHIHEPLVPTVGWMALSVPKPTVATFHADAPAWVSSVYKRAPWVAGRLQRAVLTAVSNTAAASLPPEWGEPRIVPNAVDVDSYRMSEERVAHRVAFLGRDEPRKGLSVLLEAWPKIRQRLPNGELVVMGTRRSDAPDGVRFIGPVSGEDKKRLLASSQVYVAPNLGGESFGIVVIEAMAAGCAVVASDIAAFVEVTGGDAAVHVPVGDASALGTAVAGLLEDQTKAAVLGEAGTRRAQQFDWPVVVDQYRGLYVEAISQ